MDNPFLIIENRLDQIEHKIDQLIKISSSSQQIMEKEIGSIEMAAEVTGLSRHTIYRMTSEGKIPFSKKYGKLYFNRKSILEWIEEDKTILSSSSEPFQ